MPDMPSDSMSGDDNSGLDSDIQLSRTAAFSDLVVSSNALDLLRGDWGGVLSCAPIALGRLGQCFVLASDPLASLLQFPEKAGLPRTSLRANFVHCSKLGRQAFEEAESKMRQLSLVTQALCEPGGIFDEILQDVEDPYSAEFELPDQLATLKATSEACVAHTVSIKKKVDDWMEFTLCVYEACVDEDETLKRNENDLKAQVQDKKLAVGLKSTDVTNIQKLAEYHSSQISHRKEEFTKAQKALPKRGLPYLGRTSKKPSKFGFSNGNINVNSGNLLSMFGKIGMTANWARKEDADTKSSDKPHGQGDQLHSDYELAGRLYQTVHKLAELLTLGQGDCNGVAWEALAGRGESRNSVRSIRNSISRELSSVEEEHSGVIRRVRSAIRPVQRVLEALTSMVKKETSVNAKIEVDVAESANTWREEVTAAQEQLSEILGEQVELTRRQTQEDERQGNLHAKNRLSRIELRYQRLRLAQKDLREVEQQVNQLRRKEQKAKIELEVLEQETQKLFESEVTMAHVKRIVCECVDRLHDFGERLVELASFFTILHDHIKVIDESRVASFIRNVEKANKRGDHIRDPQTNEKDRLRLEQKREKDLVHIKAQVLDLKARYRVANVMTTTYVEVSNRYIMPGVARIDRLSLLKPETMSKEVRVQQVREIDQLAREGQKDISRHVNACRDQHAATMFQKRGEIEEMEERRRITVE